MKSIIEKINESFKLISEVKKDIIKDGIPDMTEKTKVLKQYLVNLEGKTSNYLPEWLSKWYGYINMWLEKNAVKIVSQCDSENKPLPKELHITYPAGLSGTIKLEWSGSHGPIVTLQNAELKPSYVSGPEISSSSFYSAIDDFRLFKLQNQIEVDAEEYNSKQAAKAQRSKELADFRKYRHR